MAEKMFQCYQLFERKNKMNALENKKFVICDVDGTIFDRMPFYTDVFVRICARHGVSKDLARDIYIATAGNVIFLQFETAFQKAGVRYAPEMIEKCGQDFWAGAKEAPVVLFPKARETLESFRERNLLLFASSGSRTDKLIKLFTEHKLPQFELILGSEELPKGPEHIYAFAERVNLPAQEFADLAVFIGDGPSDMRLAKQFGIFGIGVTTTTTAEALLNAGAKITIPLLSSILEI